MTAAKIAAARKTPPIVESVTLTGDRNSVIIAGCFHVRLPPFGGSLTERVAKAVDSVGFVLLGTVDPHRGGFVIPRLAVVWPR